MKQIGESLTRVLPSIRTWVLVAALTVPSAASAQEPQWIADINASVQRYWNREVVVEGQVVNVQADPIGTTRGYYTLIDDSDPNGLRIQSKELPAPGQMFRVGGIVLQDPRNTVRPLLAEKSRRDIGRGWIFYAIIASAIIAVVLIIALIVTLTRRDSSPGAFPVPIPHVDDKTIPVPDDPTVPWEHWGVTLRILEGPGQGSAFPVGVSPFRIGRSGGRRNEAELKDKTVSRTQAVIRRNGKTGTFSLQNESDSNPTMIDGKPVDAVELRPGMQIRAGATLLIFESDG